MAGRTRDLEALVPADADLPGTGWLAIAGHLSEGGDRGGEVFDCVGDDFPEHQLVATHDSPRFLRPPGALVYAIAARFDEPEASTRAVTVLRGADFAECLARSVVADLGQADAEILETDVVPVSTELGIRGHRATFTGGGEQGIAAVHLDVVVLDADDALSVIWFADLSEPFSADERDHVLESIRRRIGA